MTTPGVPLMHRPRVRGARRWPRALLLDLDGTLLDTEGLWLLAERAAVERFGGRLSDAVARELRGVDTDTMVEMMRDRAGARADRDVLVAAVMEELGARVAGARACPGAAELVTAARDHGVACAVVSNSTASLVAAGLASHAWAAVIAVRVSADDVARPKPAPDMYALAATRLGLDASACVAVEDSSAGVRGAIAAGVCCLGVTDDPEHAAELRGVTPHVFGSLHDVRRWLGLDGEAAEDPRMGPPVQSPV